MVVASDYTVHLIFTGSLVGMASDHTICCFEHYMVPKDIKGNKTETNVDVRCKIDTGVGVNVMPISILRKFVQQSVTPLRQFAEDSV